MQKNVAYLQIALNKELHRWSGYLICILMLGCMIAMGQIQKPQPNNNRIVVLAAKPGSIGCQVIEGLLQDEGMFSFYTVDSMAEVQKELQSGNALCGFVLNEEFDDLVQAGKQKDCITYYTMAETAQGRVARETVYAAFFEQCSPWLMEKGVKELKPEKEAEFADSANENYHAYLESGQLFSVEFVKENLDEAASDKKEELPCYPLEGMFMAFIFLRMLLVNVEWNEANQKLFLSILPSQERIRYKLMNQLAAVFPLVLVGIPALMLINRSYAFGKLLVAAAAAVVLCSVWSFIVGKLFQKEKTQAVWIATFTIAFVLISPVFVRMDQWVLPLSYVSRFNPVGLFLWMVEKWVV